MGAEGLAAQNSWGWVEVSPAPRESGASRDDAHWPTTWLCTWIQSDLALSTHSQLHYVTSPIIRGVSKADLQLLFEAYSTLCLASTSINCARCFRVFGL